MREFLAEGISRVLDGEGQAQNPGLLNLFS